MNIVARGLVISALLLIASCRAAPIFDAVNVPFPKPVAAASLSMEDYKQAIGRAGAKRGWTFKEIAPGHLVGSVTVRGKHHAKVDVKFDTTSFSITYKSSRNLNYNAGLRAIHPNYSRWVENLQQDIQREVTLAGSG